MSEDTWDALEEARLQVALEELTSGVTLVASEPAEGFSSFASSAASELPGEAESTRLIAKQREAEATERVRELKRKSESVMYAESVDDGFATGGDQISLEDRSHAQEVMDFTRLCAALERRGYQVTLASKRGRKIFYQSPQPEGAAGADVPGVTVVQEGMSGATTLKGADWTKGLDSHEAMTHRYNRSQAARLLSPAAAKVLRAAIGDKTSQQIIGERLLEAAIERGDVAEGF